MSSIVFDQKRRTCEHCGVTFVANEDYRAVLMRKQHEVVCREGGKNRPPLSWQTRLVGYVAVGIVTAHQTYRRLRWWLR